MAISDVISELNRILAAGIISDYAIGGAVAAGTYVEAASTMDIDVFIVFGDPQGSLLAPLGPVWADLVAHGAKEEGEYLVIGDWPVQLLMGMPLHEDAVANARTVSVGGQSARIMGPEHLAAIALATGRAKDYVRIEEMIRRGVIDRTILDGLITRFDLTPQWDNFRTKFLTANA